MGRERAATEAAEARLREAHEASMGALEACNGWERRTLEAQAERDVALARLRSIEEAEAAVRTQSPERTGVWLPLTLRVKFPLDAGSDHCVHLMEIVENLWLITQEP
jgi:hypothetical protein